jgi:hypothetical protein
MDLEALQDTPPWEWPEEAGEEFLRVLRDPQAAESDRLIAAELAGDFVVVDDEIVDKLLSILVDSTESEELRAQAAISLGPALEQAHVEAFDDPDAVPISEATFDRAQETLATLYKDSQTPKLLRRRALEASVRAPQDWHPEAVQTAYRSGDPDWTLTAVFCMEHVPGFESEIVKFVKSDDEMLRYHAICAAGAWEVDPAWPDVVAIIQSETNDTDLLIAAIEAGTYIRPQEIAEVIQHLVDSEDEDVAEAANNALALAEIFLSEEEDEGDDDEEE